MKLSIIISFYNLHQYVGELLEILDKQMRKEVEVILVDDGSEIPFTSDYKWLRIFRKQNGGVSTARNLGLNYAVGEYITFIDADDIVPDYYLDRLLKAIEEGCDVIEFSWRSIKGEGQQYEYQLKEGARLSNPSVCTRAFKRSFIGDTRFNEKKDSTEDEDFSRRLGYLDNTKEYTVTFIPEFMYFYRTAVEDSKVKRFKKGLMNSKRIIYNVPHVRANMTDLLEEIKHEDEMNEVWLFTDNCELPELKKYCRVKKASNMWCHDLRGEPCPRVTVIVPPIKTQVLLYVSFANTIGGIPTFIYNFCAEMHEYYDILVLYENLDEPQIERLKKLVPVMRYVKDREYVCDTLILNRLTDILPPNISYKKSVQMCHACKQKTVSIPPGRDEVICVSEVAKESWGDVAKDAKVIHNVLHKDDKDCLFLVSATRVNARDKGDNDARMIKLAKMLDDAGIKYVWLNFADSKLNVNSYGFINMPATYDIQSYIKKADYLVQLSDAEAFCFSLVEALTLGTAILSTDLPVLKELGVEDKKHGYIVPLDMNFDVKKLLDIPKFDYEYDNQSVIDKWRGLLGNTTPKQKYVLDEKVLVEILVMYKDIDLNRMVFPKQRIYMSKARADYLAGKRLVRKVGWE